MEETKIPKIIHYCWFGGKPLPEDVRYYISTWKAKLPDYQIKEWNETNYNINESVPYVREAYQSGKWAFVTDYVRLYALYNEGGIYLDTDVEVFRSFDTFLNDESFMGFESKDYVATAVMGCAKGNSVIFRFMESYKTKCFIREDGSFDINTNVDILTEQLIYMGLKLNGKRQNINGMVIYPQYFFSPNDLCNIFGKYKSHTYSYHHCNASWYDHNPRKSIKTKVRHYILGIARDIIGTRVLYKMRHKG